MKIINKNGVKYNVSESLYNAIKENAKHIVTLSEGVTSNPNNPNGSTPNQETPQNISKNDMSYINAFNDLLRNVRDDETQKIYSSKSVEDMLKNVLLYNKEITEIILNYTNKLTEMIINLDDLKNAKKNVDGLKNVINNAATKIAEIVVNFKTKLDYKKYRKTYDSIITNISKSKYIINYDNIINNNTPKNKLYQSIDKIFTDKITKYNNNENIDNNFDEYMIKQLSTNNIFKKIKDELSQKELSDDLTILNKDNILTVEIDALIYTDTQQEAKKITAKMLEDDPTIKLMSPDKINCKISLAPDRLANNRAIMLSIDPKNKDLSDFTIKDIETIIQEGFFEYNNASDTISKYDMYHYIIYSKNKKTSAEKRIFEATYNMKKTTKNDINDPLKPTNELIEALFGVEERIIHTCEEYSTFLQKKKDEEHCNNINNIIDILKNDYNKTIKIVKNKINKDIITPYDDDSWFVYLIKRDKQKNIPNYKYLEEAMKNNDDKKIINKINEIFTFKGDEIKNESVNGVDNILLEDKAKNKKSDKKEDEEYTTFKSLVKKETLEPAQVVAMGVFSMSLDHDIEKRQMALINQEKFLFDKANYVITTMDINTDWEKQKGNIYKIVVYFYSIINTINHIYDSKENVEKSVNDIYNTLENANNDTLKNKNKMQKDVENMKHPEFYQFNNYHGVLSSEISLFKLVDKVVENNYESMNTAEKKQVKDKIMSKKVQEKIKKLYDSEIGQGNVGGEFNNEEFHGFINKFRKEMGRNINIQDIDGYKKANSDIDSNIQDMRKVIKMIFDRADEWGWLFRHTNWDFFIRGIKPNEDNKFLNFFHMNSIFKQMKNIKEVREDKSIKNIFAYTNLTKAYKLIIDYILKKIYDNKESEQVKIALPKYVKQYYPILNEIVCDKSINNGKKISSNIDLGNIIKYFNASYIPYVNSANPKDDLYTKEYPPLVTEAKIAAGMFYEFLLVNDEHSIQEALSLLTENEKFLEKYERPEQHWTNRGFGDSYVMVPIIKKTGGNCIGCIVFKYRYKIIKTLMNTLTKSIKKIAL